MLGGQIFAHFTTCVEKIIGMRRLRMHNDDDTDHAVKMTQQDRASNKHVIYL